MIKLISFAMQMFLLKKTFTKTTSSFEYIERAAQKAQSYFLFAIGSITAAVFLLIAVVVAIIGICLQIEQHGALSFTGLLISATIFFLISMFLFAISYLLLILQKQRAIELQRIKEREQAASGSHITPILEEILKQVLTNLAKPKDPPKPPPQEPVRTKPVSNDEQ